MELAKTQKRFTVDEYFAYEAGIQGKAEYHDGFIVDMAGGSAAHGQISLNLGAALKTRLKGKGCIVYPSDVKVKAEEANAYLYPDISVECGRPMEERKGLQHAGHPCLIAEVLSESTVLDDLGVKFFAYQRIPSLESYLLIDQYAPSINVIHRNSQGEWVVHTFMGLDSELEIPPLGISIPLQVIYEDVAFPDNKSPLLGIR